MYVTGNQDKRVIPIIASLFLTGADRTSYRKDVAQKVDDDNLVFLHGPDCFFTSKCTLEAQRHKYPLTVYTQINKQQVFIEFCLVCVSQMIPNKTLTFPSRAK